MTAAFAAYLAALLTAHTVADHWIQTHHQATCKGKPGRVGALACLRHVATYTATTALFGLLVWQVLDLPLSWLGFLTGQFLSATTHYLADRRVYLERFARWIGKADFLRLGVPRTGTDRNGNAYDDNPSLGTAGYSLDQSFHHLCLFAAALLTVIL
ncbi:DUF3307 domain-containing protein [Kribbella catacumbae]|uniref:DUF3307 domain-containing protein n=1 Tax=Kribbella catacumbae TaxID=460086 RepID=UPI00037EDFE5|nr:DUF3307 domain-containing protein [Kribbella catacumbae]